MTDTRIKLIAAHAEPFAYAALRIIGGLMFAFHGAQIIFGWHMESMSEFNPQIWIGGLIELLGGVLAAIGLYTRPAAFLASGTMAVAYVQFHWKFAIADGRWIPVLNQGELAVLYCFLFLFIAARGGGVASLDGSKSR
jgi:putative oxidoreductase